MSHVYFFIWFGQHKCSFQNSNLVTGPSLDFDTVMASSDKSFSHIMHCSCHKRKTKRSPWRSVVSIALNYLITKQNTNKLVVVPSPDDPMAGQPFLTLSPKDSNDEPRVLPNSCNPLNYSLRSMRVNVNSCLHVLSWNAEIKHILLHVGRL